MCKSVPVAEVDPNQVKRGESKEASLVPFQPHNSKVSDRSSSLRAASLPRDDATPTPAPPLLQANSRLKTGPDTSLS